MFSLASSTPPLSPQESKMGKADLEAKAKEINLVLSEPNVDLWRLRELALTEGGLVNDTLRRRAWPKLVGLHNEKEDTGTQTRSQTTSSKLTYQQQVPRCVDAEQIDRDTARCTWHLLTGSQRSRRLQMENKHRRKVSALLHKKQTRLGNLINLTLLLETEGQLRYYQGYHDVACIFLHTLGGGGSGPMPVSPEQALAASMGLDLPSRVLLQVSKSHLRDAMRSSFHELQVALRLILFPLMCALDPQVHDHLYDCDMEPFFALSWVITWFAHDVRDTALVKRLFDAMLVSHPLFVIYMSVAMVLHPVNRMEVLQADCDFASVHQALVALPKNSSMVGWSFHPTEGGYVSGEEADDNGTVCTDMDLGSVISDEALDGQFFGEDVASQGSASLLSLSQLGDNPRVPFQEIIDSALSYMRRVPPRKLLSLSKRYFAKDAIRPLLEHCDSISLLKPPPSWGLASTTPADWVLKQRLRESRGLKATNRRDRRNRSKVEASMKDLSNEQLDKYLEEKKKTLAVIASGVGRADDEEEERRKKRRKLMLYSGAALGLVALSCVVVIQYGPSLLTVTGPPHSETEVSQRNLVASRKSGPKPPEQTSTNRTKGADRTQPAPPSRKFQAPKREPPLPSTPAVVPMTTKSTRSDTVQTSTQSTGHTSSGKGNKIAEIEAERTAGGAKHRIASYVRNDVKRALIDVGTKLGPGMRFVKENMFLRSVRFVKDKVLLPTVPRVRRFVGGFRLAMTDLRKLPAFSTLGRLSDHVFYPGKESDVRRILGNLGVRSFVDSAQKSLAESDCEVVAI